MTDRKILSRRPMIGIKSADPVWHDLTAGAGILLSDILGWSGFTDKVYVCGSLEQMTREWMMGPLSKGWKLDGQFVFKHRTAVYVKDDAKIAVKLASHRAGWFPDCEDAKTACDAWEVLKAEWERVMRFPLLSSPAATGKAALWQNLPTDPKTKAPIEFPSLPDDVAKLIRAISPQHRIENLKSDAAVRIAEDCVYQYDGRWMYAAMCGLDRFPVGEPRHVGGFRMFQPGWHHVAIQIPDDWNHIGLLPYQNDNGWEYPTTPGSTFITWASEPELTLAIQNGWKIREHYDGYEFDKGRPLGGWAKKLIDMRFDFQRKEEAYVEAGAMGDGPAYRFASAAVRQILNHTIGAIHVDGFEREKFITKDEFRAWRRENPYLAESEHHGYTVVEGGYLVPSFVPDTSRLAMYMPHWSATIYALSRARVAQWALRCDGKEGRPGPEALVKIHGDAIYSTSELPFEDNGRLGQLRRKE